MTAYLLMFGFGLLLLGSWIGWGWAIGRLLRLKPLDTGLQVGLGLSFLIIVGGFLNYFALVSKVSLLTLTAGGLVALAASLWKAPRPSLRLRPSAWAAAAVIATLALLNYASAVAPASYSKPDDYRAYFAFAEKMIQTGHLGSDPYSERRVINSLGGQTFLDSFVLTAGTPDNLDLLDRGVAYLALLLAVLGLANAFALPLLASALVLATVASAAVPISNITATFTSMVLVVTLIRLVDRRAIPERRRDFLMVMTAAALLALKNSMAVTVGLLAAAYLATMLAHGERKTAPRRVVVMLAGVVALVLPWALASLAATGTLFYPLLGLGYHASAYGGFLAPTTGYGLSKLAYSLTLVMVWEPVYLLLAVLAAAGVVSRKIRQSLGLSGLLVTGAALLGVVALTYSTGGYGVDRYTYPFVFPSVLFLLIKMLKACSREVETVAVYVTIAALLMVGLANVYIDRQEFRHKLANGVTGSRIDSAVEQQRYAAAQATVPPGAPMLISFNKNYLMDFRRNPVCIADFPGSASLPPGMPFQKGPEALARYLTDRGLRYVGFSYFAKEDYGFQLESIPYPWLRSEADHLVDYQDNVTSLSNTRQRLFDEEGTIILDLATRR